MSYVRRKEEIARVCNRLERLLREEPSPRSTMMWLNNLLLESALPIHLPVDSPASFVANLQMALEEADPTMYSLPMRNLRLYENAEELALDLLPTIRD